MQYKTSRKKIVAVRDSKALLSHFHWKVDSGYLNQFDVDIYIHARLLLDDLDDDDNINII